MAPSRAPASHTDAVLPEKCERGSDLGTGAALDDAEAVKSLQALTLEYVTEYREPGRWTIENVVGQRRTRDNLIAAIAWAEAGNYEAAETIVDEVLQTQQLDPTSPQYGYFPLLLGNQPTASDQVWMLFGGSFLAVLLDRHAGRLPFSLVARIRDAVRAAATGASHLAPPLTQTSQTLLQAHLVLRAGEILDDPQLVEAGEEVWRQFIEFTNTSGITELGSPNYAKIHLYALGFIVDYVRNATVRAQAETVRRIVWWSLSRHYHKPTRQLGGPFSRTLTDRMINEMSGVHFSLFRESGGRIPLPSATVQPSGYSFLDVGNAEARLHAVLATLFDRSWPEPWVGIALCMPREYQFRERTMTYPQPARPTGLGFEQFTTFLTPHSSLGSRNREGYGMSPETRDVVAYTASDGSVGIFRYRLADGSTHLTR